MPTRESTERQKIKLEKERGSTLKPRPQPGMCVLLMNQGVQRVLDGKPGMTFIIDSVTETARGGEYNVHVRDYRLHGEKRNPAEPWCIWTLGPDEYALINFVAMSEYRLSVVGSERLNVAGIIHEFSVRGDEAAKAQAKAILSEDVWRTAKLVCGDRVVENFIK